VTRMKLEGLYLIVSPVMPFDKLLVTIKNALKGDVDLLQLIPREESSEVSRLAKDLSSLTEQHEVPFLINGNLQLAKEVGANGLHLDRYDITPSEVRQVLGKHSIIGYTIGDNLEKVKWAETVGADYVSFCSVFPTSSVAQCDIVPLETIKAAKIQTTLPVFAAGGINFSNIEFVLKAGVDGIAVTSVLLAAEDPEQTALALKEVIRNVRKAKR
jgi:thiamine-phosphate pyrophosphorylase